MSWLDLLFAAVLGVLAVGVGLRWLRAFDALPEDPSDRAALGGLLGLGLLALGTAMLGEFGRLDRTGLGATLGLAGLLGLGDVRAWLKSARIPERDPSPVWDLALVLGLLGTLLTALGPVTDGDALCYHLQVPKVFLNHRAFMYEPDLHETVYPLVTESLYAIALAFRGPVACRLIQWLIGVLFAANVTALARPSLGPRARRAGTIVLLVPAVSNGMSAPLNDVALAAFSTAALHALVLWWGNPTTRRIVMAGCAAGLAIGVKYPALVWVGLLTFLIVERSLRGEGSPPARARRLLLALTAFGSATLAFGGLWYARAYEFTGNPVYPFFRGVFGTGLEEVLDPARKPMAPTAWNVATALVPMTLQPARFDSLSHQFGPVFLLFLPPLLLLKSPRRVVGLAVLGWAFLTLCLTQRQSTRFVLTAMGPMAVGAAWVATRVARIPGIASRLAGGVIVTVLLAEAVIAAGRSRHALPVLLGRESPAAFLARREPTFRVGRWIDSNLAASVRIIGQDHRGFYLARDYTMELAHRRRTGLARRGEGAERIVESLRQEGFTHVLFCPPIPESAVEFDPTLSRRLEPWTARHAPVYREDLADADGVVRRYAIYELGPRAVADAEMDRRVRR